MIKYDRPASMTAFEAISEAQKLAFSPIAFQAARALLRLGILRFVADRGEEGADADSIAERLGLTSYGVRVLLDMGLSMGLVWASNDRYVLDKVGYFMLEDKMTQVNMDFVGDVCYEAMNVLQDSVRQSLPGGLTRFGDWPTLYPGLTSLPEPARGSWFRFDHFYSTNAFSEALDLVFSHEPRHILDIGGNTGLWALACAEYDENVRITIVDLPEQTQAACEHLGGSPFAARIDTFPLDILRPSAKLPSGADAVWMSQFLDCFSEPQIVEILRFIADGIAPETPLFILETFWDRQQHAAAAYSLNATSLYFTCIANGVSRMYRSDDMRRMIEQSGFSIVAERDNLGLAHTLLHCQKSR